MLACEPRSSFVTYHRSNVGLETMTIMNPADGSSASFVGGQDTAAYDVEASPPGLRR